MEDIIDLIATDSSPNQISDAIKNSLYSKSSERINSMRPNIASSMFGSEESDFSNSSEE
jgi:hypothetical protein